MGEDSKKRIRERVLKNIDYYTNISDEELRAEIYRNINLEAAENVLPLGEREMLTKEVYNSIRGMDVLAEILEDDTVSEIMINGHDTIFVERQGKIYKYGKAFESKEKLADIIQQIVAGVNRVVNESTPIADARLPDGSRVNIVLPPVAINGPIVTIRRFPKDPMTMERLLEHGAITKNAATFLETLVKAKYNIFICGGTGSGKTTFLNALSDFIPSDERIITIEDSAELKIRNIENLVRLEVRNKNSGECQEITIRDLIRSALRMRPDRIIVGEVRGDEITDMLQAMATGHDGSFSTAHGNSIPDMLDRLETMMIMGIDMPLRAVRKQIASAIDIMVHIGRLRDGSRKVLEICEVVGVSDGEIELNPLYKFRETEKQQSEAEENEKVAGELFRTGNSFICRGKLKRAGLELKDA